MDFLKDAFSADSALMKLGSSYLQGLANNASKPKPVKIVQAAPAPAPAVASASGLDLKKWGLIGGGVLGLIVVLALVMKRK